MSESGIIEKRGWTTERILRRVYELGHFHNPSSPTGITEAEVGRLRLTDPEARAAIKSAQEFMAGELNHFASIRHGHAAHADGRIGDATIDILTMERCGCPDYRIPGSPMMSMEQANWPTACRGKLRFGRAFRAMRGLDAEGVARAWWAICNNITQALSDVNMTPADVGDRSAEIFAELGRLGRNVLAQSYLAQNRCDVKLGQIYNSEGVDWGQLDLTVTTGTHEVGHAIGLMHDPDPQATMYFSVTAHSRGRYGYFNSSDAKQAQRLGYKPSGLPQLPLDRLFGPPRTDDPGPDPQPPGDDPPAEALRLVGDVPGGKIYFLPLVRV